MKIRMSAAGVIACLILTLSPSPSKHASAAPSLQVWDNFHSAFTVDSPDAKWFTFGVAANGLYDGSPEFYGNDGITTTGPDGLTVVPRGTNPNTGQPAFTKTVAQNAGLPGAFDHVKWLVYANHTSSSGYPGFDALPGQQLVCQSTIGGETFGTAANPFGDTYVDGPNDLRLAAVSMPVIDFQTYSVFDTWVTNDRIYAFYEHLPFLRSDFGGPDINYQAYSSAIPIATRKVGDMDTVALAYDRQNGIARWLVNGVEKYRVGVGTAVDPIGSFPPTQYTLLDHGGSGTLPLPTQLDCGMGMFTLLDGYGKGGVGLVQLDPSANIYLDPTRTDGTLEQFVDPNSSASDRLWGQGAELHVKHFTIGYWPSTAHDENNQ